MSHKPTTANVGTLPKNYPDLHKSKEVSLHADTKKQPVEKIGQYLTRLEGRHGFFGGNQKRTAAQILHRTVRYEDIPQAYWNKQEEIQFDQGMEFWNDGEIYEKIVDDQSKSLEVWVDCLNSDNANYPTWFKYAVMRSVLKMAGFDQSKGRFRKRNKGTTELFPDLNQEALALVFNSYVRALSSKGFTDEELEKLSKSGNFAKLYTHAYKEMSPVSPELRKTIDGEWRKFNQIEGDYTPDYDVEDDNYEKEDKNISNSTVKSLTASLRGQGSGWCTAGDATAAYQLSRGDFYIYYSKDADGQSTIPRLAIRMEGDEISEVRGVANKAQEVEDSLLGVLEEKLNEFPDAEEYKRRIETKKIYKKIKSKIKKDPGSELSQEEIWLLLGKEDFGFAQTIYRNFNPLTRLRDERYENAPSRMSSDWKLLIDGLGEEEVIERFGKIDQVEYLLTLPHEISGSFSLEFRNRVLARIAEDRGSGGNILINSGLQYKIEEINSEWMYSLGQISSQAVRSLVELYGEREVSESQVTNAITGFLDSFDATANEVDWSQFSGVLGLVFSLTLKDEYQKDMPNKLKDRLKNVYLTLHLAASSLQNSSKKERKKEIVNAIDAFPGWINAKKDKDIIKSVLSSKIPTLRAEHN